MYYYYYYYYSSGINTRTENNNNIIVYTTHNDWTKRNVLWFLFTLLSLTVFSSAKSISSIVPVAGSVSTIYRMDNDRRNNNCRGRCTFPCFVFSISAKQTSHPRFVMNIQSLFFYSSHLPRWDPVKHKFRAKNCINHPRTLYIVNYNNKPQTRSQLVRGARNGTEKPAIEGAKMNSRDFIAVCHGKKDRLLFYCILWGHTQFCVKLWPLRPNSIKHLITCCGC